MADFVNLSLIGDYLELGGLGFVCGVLLPFGFRLIGYVVDSVFLFVKG